MKLSKLALALLLSVGLATTGCTKKNEVNVPDAELAARLAIAEAEVAALREEQPSSEVIVTADVANALPETEESVLKMAVPQPDRAKLLTNLNIAEMDRSPIRPTQLSGEQLDYYYIREDVRDAAIRAVADQIEPKFLDELNVEVLLVNSDSPNSITADITYTVRNYTADTTASITNIKGDSAKIKVKPVDLGL